MEDYSDLIGPEPPIAKTDSGTANDFSDLIGKPPVPINDTFEDLIGKPDEPSIVNPTTFDWKEVVGKAVKSVPAVQAAQFVGQMTSKEESAVASPILDVMRGKNPIPTIKDILLAGGVGVGSKKEKESLYKEQENEQLGDIFRELGWSEPAAATAGLALSMLLPSNFLLGGLGAKKVPVSKLFNPGEDIIKNSVARRELIDNAMQVGASQELFKSKVLKIFESDGIKEAYQTFKDQLLQAPDNLSARSIALEHNDWIEKSQLVQAKAAGAPIRDAFDKVERIYYDSLPPIKVADAAGGYQGYGSWGPQLFADVGRAETAGIYSNQLEMHKLADELIAKGIKNVAIDEDSGVRLVINTYKRQAEKNVPGAKNAVEQILKLKGWKEVPTLTPDEEKVLQTVVDSYKPTYPELSEKYKLVTGKDMGELPDYAFMSKFQGELSPTIQELLDQTGRKPRFSPAKAFTERKENLEVPRTDFWNLVQETKANQQWFLHTMPAILDMEKKVASKEFTDYFKSNSDKMALYARDYILAVKNKGQLTNSNPYSEALKAARGNITKATLTFKASSVLGQFGTLFDIIAFSLPELGVGATRELIPELIKVMALPGYRKAVVKGSKALSVRQGGEMALDELLHEGGLNALTKLGMKPLQAADMIPATAFEGFVKKILKKRGMEASKIDDYADMLMNLVNGSSEVSYRPLVLSRGEGAKTLLTFQTFFMYHWATMAHDLINKGLIRGSMEKKMLAGLGLALLGAGDVAQDQARKYLYEKVTGNEIKKKESPYLQDMMWSYWVNVPFFGQLSDALLRGRSPEPPLIRQFENVVTGTKQLFGGKTPESRLRGGIKAGEAAITPFVPLPGLGQVADLAQRMIPKESKKVPLTKQQKLRKSLLKRG